MTTPHPDGARDVFGESFEEAEPWEAFEDEVGEDDDDTSPPNKLQASTELVDMLLQLYLSGAMTATSLSIMCYWIHHAGVEGHVRDLAFPPGRPSGRYKRHIDAALGVNSTDERLYELDVPGHSKHGVGRLVTKVLVQPHHRLPTQQPATSRSETFA